MERKEEKREIKGRKRKRNRRRRAIAAVAEGWSRTTTFPRVDPDLDSSASFLPFSPSRLPHPRVSVSRPRAPSGSPTLPSHPALTDPNITIALIRVQPRVANGSQNMDPP